MTYRRIIYPPARWRLVSRGRTIAEGTSETPQQAREALRAALRHALTPQERNIMTIETAGQAREYIAHALRMSNTTAGTDNLSDIVKECFNCRAADANDDGDVWIADPQSGHWINGDDAIKLARFIQQRDGAWIGQPATL